MKGFRNFILRGNVVDLAVGVMVGAAFSAVINSLVKDLFSPLISALVHQPDFSKWEFTFRGVAFPYGDFINALISFLIIATTIYFFVVVPTNKLLARFKGTPDAPKKSGEEKLLEEIRDLLRTQTGAN
jgi:large conductance mechanosensitive channel